MTTDYTHPDYKHWSPMWAKVRAAAAGEEAIKAGGETYLPNPSEGSRNIWESNLRYQQYLRRAVWFGATGNTLAGLVGVAFANWPTIEISNINKVLLTDADGSGVGLIGQSQAVLSDVLQTGRAGLLADWSAWDGSKRKRTVAQAEAAGARAFVTPYTAEQILTWETQGGRLTRVVLSESFAEYAGGEVKFLPQLRELFLEEGGAVALTWRKYTANGEFILVDTVRPTMGGKQLQFVPFAFVGATNNDATCDSPPLLDLANLNLAHYRNSADYEESSFLMGQPQLVIAGVDEEWVKARGGPIVFGAREALALPAGATADLLQVAPNTIAKEAMADKVAMMEALGARLMASSQAVKTATQSAAETKAAYSVLSLACDNVSEAYSRVLTWAQMGMPSAGAASFAIDTRFNDLTLDANAIRETVAAWQAGLVPQSDAWAVLRRLNVIDQGKTDQQIAGEIEAQGPSLNLDAAA